MPDPASLILKAHAKLNLALAVGPAQPPKGYHPIASWFVAIELHDTLLLERLPEGRPSCFDIRWATDAPKPTPIDWPIENDLAVRAHGMLERHTGRSLPLSVTLDKRIPVGGGLGGGSSDAAAMLSGVNTLFGLGLARSELSTLSMRLGSDIAFFLADAIVPRPALVTGFGDRIERRPSGQSVEALLLIPPFGCPTGPVYQAFDRSPTTGVDESRVRALMDAEASRGVSSRDLFNDLAEPACEVEPRLRGVLDTLRGTLGGAVPVHVTGSGSTMFVLVGAHEAGIVAETIRRVCPGVVVLPTRTLG